MGNFITKICAAFLDWTGAELEQIGEQENQ